MASLASSNNSAGDSMLVGRINGSATASASDTRTVSTTSRAQIASEGIESCIRTVYAAVSDKKPAVFRNMVEEALTIARNAGSDPIHIIDRFQQMAEAIGLVEEHGQATLQQWIAEAASRDRATTVQELKLSGATSGALFAPEARRSVNPSVTVQSARDLRNRIFQPMRFVLPGYIPEGCTILAGRPKLGKSWMMLDVSLAVASNGSALGSAVCERGDVLYLALEDNERRLQSRIKQLIGGGAEWPSRLYYVTEWPRADAGGLEAIRRWIKNADNPRLVVVDVLAMLRSPRIDRTTPYESDYQAIKGLQTIASETGIAIVIVHHLRKSGSELDPFEKVSGTYGLLGAADTVLILDRSSQGTTLYRRGRDIEEIETAVEFVRDSCRWRVMGDVGEVRRSDQRKAILRALEEANEPLSSVKLADLVGGASYDALRRTLLRMTAAGEVIRTKRGLYACPNCLNVPTHPPDHCDNETDGTREEVRAKEQTCD